MMTDQELATLVAGSGDEMAFTELVERHQLAIRRFLRRLLAGDVSAADDLAQETFLVAFRKIHTWKGTAKLSTWLHSIAYRQFLDLQRKQKRVFVMAEVPETGQDSSQNAHNEILAQQLLSQLDIEDRTFLTLSYAAGMSHREISEVTGRPLGSVKARIHRAKGKLQQWLKVHDHPIQIKTPVKDQRHA